ncbi:MAG: hypothetical protein ABIH39_06250 [Candidatus Margulisiibacteriota bacterium]
MNQKGFSLLEILVSTGLFLTIFFAAIGVRLITTQNMVKAKMLRTRTISTQNMLEKVLAADFNQVAGEIISTELKKVSIGGETLYVVDVQ